MYLAFAAQQLENRNVLSSSLLLLGVLQGHWQQLRQDWGRSIEEPQLCRGTCQHRGCVVSP